jgi:DNA primase
VAGRIRDSDIALVRERSPIADVISARVTLRSAGGGSLKGLCPFHDEKTPSFNVNPSRGFFHCFGCAEGGDVISFVMKTEMLPFHDAVEWLASRAGIQLTYEEGGPAPVRQTGQRQRFVAAHKAAQEYYAEQLRTPDARIAREFLAQRGFDAAAAGAYGCGFAPVGWDPLTKHLRKQGFTSDELVGAGLAKEARSGSLIDRFRRRLLWPIKDLTGDIIGFGARRLFEDDDGPKYLNTPETAIYKKSQVLYGLDVAKRDIAKDHRAVVVEGYTDVMACHLAGIKTAVATCGTAFGSEHIGVLRRLLMDQDEFRGEVIFTFDGDEAGQKAALKAFEDDQRFVAQTFIAVSPGGMDPCELRLAHGDAAVRDLVHRREPLIAFALRSVLRRYDLDTAEGRVAALRAAAPLVAKIKDRALRPEYARKLAGDLGMEVEPVLRAVSTAVTTPAAASGERRSGQPPQDVKRELNVRRPEPDDRALFAEREALKLGVQAPVLAGPLFDAVDTAAYTHAVYQTVRGAIEAAGGAVAGTSGPEWVEKVMQGCDDLLARATVSELAVEPLYSPGEPDPRYVTMILARLQQLASTRQIVQVKSRLQRINPVEQPDEHARLFGELVALEAHNRGLREQASGGL